jgi:carboxylesterase type B
MKLSRRLLASSLHLLGNVVSLTSGASIKWKVGQTVQTTSGSIVGHAASDATEVSEYLGIPYAQPPTGDLRFQPPVAYNSTGIITAKDFGSVCMQPSLALSSFRKHQARQFAGLNLTPAGIALLQSYARSIGTQGEDCLSLNVWTKPQTGDAKKAVMVDALPILEHRPRR